MNYEFLEELGIRDENPGVSPGTLDGAQGESVASISPIDGKPIAKVRYATRANYDAVVERSQVAFHAWRALPAPQRGELMRQIGLALREKKHALGQLVSLEMGKIVAEGEGEVQEMIDIADFAVGLSRQLYGKVIQSERPQHRMAEQWHPLGPVGVISAFNFPVAVWSWNAFIAAVCGNTLIWKPSPKTPLCAIAVQNIVEGVLAKAGHADVMMMVVGSNEEVGEALINDSRVPLISATGSTEMGRHVGQTVAKRLGKSILELGGNNALSVMPDANLDLALRAVVFGAVGTAGQRCTTTRRLLLHEDIYDEFLPQVQKAYGQVKIGNPLKDGVLMGPVVSEDAFDAMQTALLKAEEQGGKVLCGGERVEVEGCEGGYYVTPAIVEVSPDAAIAKTETFAPILYVMKTDSVEHAIEIQNNVPQGLSSALFTENMRYAERFVSAEGSDCGIANINIGTSGAEIGGAFGGEKETGGGREAGSDAWKAYMRRQTQTINWSTALPLAQGIEFGL